MNLKKETENSIIYSAGCVVVNTLAACYLLSAITFMVGGHLGPWVFPTAELFALLCATIGAGNSHNLLKHSFKVAILAIAVIAFCIIITWPFTDFSCDGNEYHQETIAFLMNDWNPFRNPMPDGMQIWGWHYAKGMEIISANIALMTGQLELGKAVNPLMMIGMAMMLYPTLRGLGKGISPLKSALITLLATCNPVGVCQFPSYYIDFPKYYLAVVAIILIYRIFTTGKRGAYLMLGAILVLVIGVKFNAAPDLAIVMLFAIIYAFIAKRKELGWKLLICGFAALIAGCLIFGYNPYVTNTINAGNPLFPLMGEGGEDIMTTNTPVAVQGYNRFRNFFFSLLYYEPLKHMSPGTPLGGFSIAIPAMLLLSVIGLILTWKRVSHLYVAMALTVLLSCFIFEQTWWARYIAQLWMIPVIAATAMAQTDSKLNALILYLLTLLGITGGCASGIQELRHASMFRTYRREIFEIGRKNGALKVSETSPVLIRRAGEENVKLQIVPKDSVTEETPFVYYYGFHVIQPPIRVYMTQEERDGMQWVCDW